MVSITVTGENTSPVSFNINERINTYLDVKRQDDDRIVNSVTFNKFVELLCESSDDFDFLDHLEQIDAYYIIKKN